jgi:hypothetical protein
VTQLIRKTNDLEGEIDTWEGFPKVMRKEDRELWEAMVQRVREDFGEAVERSDRLLTVEPFLMSLLVTQQKTIIELQDKVAKFVKMKTPMKDQQGAADSA